MIALILFLFSYIITKKYIYLRHLLLGLGPTKGRYLIKAYNIIMGKTYPSKNIFTAF